MDNNGLIGSFATITLLWIGHKIEWISLTMLHWHIPPFIMECAQLGAWISAIVVGSVTFHQWYKKYFNK